MIHIQTMDSKKIISGPLMIGEDWPGVFISAKFLHDNFNFLYAEMSKSEIENWLEKEKKLTDVINQMSPKNSKEVSSKLDDEYKNLKEDLYEIKKFNIQDILKNDSSEAVVRYQIFSQLAETWDYKDSGENNFTLNLQSIDSFVVNTKNFRPETGLMKIDEQYGYFMRGDATFSIGFSNEEYKNKKFKLYQNILKSCIGAKREEFN